MPTRTELIKQLMVVESKLRRIDAEEKPKKKEGKPEKEEKPKKVKGEPGEASKTLKKVSALKEAKQNAQDAV